MNHKLHALGRSSSAFPSEHKVPPWQAGTVSQSLADDFLPCHGAVYLRLAVLVCFVPHTLRSCLIGQFSRILAAFFQFSELSKSFAPGPGVPDSAQTLTAQRRCNVRAGQSII